MKQVDGQKLLASLGEGIGNIRGRLTPDAPWLRTSNGLGSIRYVDAHLIDASWWIYFEVTRPDGAHELRLAVRPAGQ